MPLPSVIPRTLCSALTAVRLAAACALAASGSAHAADAASATLTLPEVVSRAMNVQRPGEVGRARYALQAATGAALLAEGAFDWSLRNRTGFDRIYQPGTSGVFLTTDV